MLHPNSSSSGLGLGVMHALPLRCCTLPLDPWAPFCCQRSNKSHPNDASFRGHKLPGWLPQARKQARQTKQRNTKTSQQTTKNTTTQTSQQTTKQTKTQHGQRNDHTQKTSSRKLLLLPLSGLCVPLSSEPSGRSAERASHGFMLAGRRLGTWLPAMIQLPQLVVWCRPSCQFSFGFP